MTTLRQRLVAQLGGRFERYYAGVLRPGAGYPTADEARKDLRARDRAAAGALGWIR